jgi:hypothetical protein
MEPGQPFSGRKSGILLQSKAVVAARAPGKVLRISRGPWGRQVMVITVPLS